MNDEDSNDREEPVIRDKRRIDPKTGQVRQPPAEGGWRVSGPELGDGSLQPEVPESEPILTDADLEMLIESDAERLAAERLADLQRVTAEYTNYRRRTEANHEAEKERAVADVVRVLLPVLDDLDRAEKHGDLEGDAPFSTIAAKLRTATERLGLKPFAVPGDRFDHNIHEALVQQPSEDVDAETVTEVVETGYYLGSTLLRAAKVVVAVPS